MDRRHRRSRYLEPLRCNRSSDPRRKGRLDAAPTDHPGAWPRPALDSFDREAQFRESNGKSLSTLLDEFRTLRSDNLSSLRALNLQPSHLESRGAHPALGPVTLRQLLATWTAHDLAHILQVSRVMAKRYKQEVGPWAEYLSVMK